MDSIARDAGRRTDTARTTARGTHRFFGAVYQDYDFDRVVHIAEPVLVSGRRTWHDRPLTWHGDNAMERINLPSKAMGGFEYGNSLILFRRLTQDTFELRVFPWDSDSAETIGGAEGDRTLDLMNAILILGDSSKKRSFVLTCVFTCYYSNF